MEAPHVEENLELYLDLIREAVPELEWRAEAYSVGYVIFSSGGARGGWSVDFSGLIVSATLKDWWITYEILGDDSPDDIRFTVNELAPLIAMHARGEVREERVPRSWFRRDRLRLIEGDGSATVCTAAKADAAVRRAVSDSVVVLGVTVETRLEDSVTASGPAGAEPVAAGYGR